MSLNSRREKWLLPATGLLTILGIAVLCLPTAPPRPTVLVDVGGRSIPVYGANDRHIGIIKESFNFLPLSVKKSVSAINVLDWLESQDHFEGIPNLTGDCHFDGEICVRGDSLDCRLIWHEASHAYAFTLSDEFEKEWLKAADGIQYGAYPEDAEFPRNGILTNYGSTNWQEDVAEWLAEIYCYISSPEHSSFCPICINDVDVSGYRYLPKLDLLLKWGFISKEDYEHIKPLLE